MALFSYEIIDKDGKKKKGNVEADTYEMARSLVKKEASTIISIAETSSLNKDISFGKKKARSRDLSVFCRQFASITKAGISIIEALGMLEQQTGKKSMAEAIGNVRINVQKGETLANAMAKEEIFPNMLVSMVDAGEQSGSLEKSLERMATHFEKDNRMKGMVKKAMIYPIILFIVAIAVLVIMLVKVLPSFMATFIDMDIDMPGFTLAVMAFSDFLVENAVVVLIVVVLIALLIKVIAGTPSGKRAFAKLKLKLPVFGNLTIKTACARFTRTFATLLGSGMDISEALEITSRAIDNVLYEDAIKEIGGKIRGGLNLSVPFRANADLFPPMVYHMIGIGEETGNLEEMLDNVATYYDEEVTMATEQLTAFMEPMVILFLAVIVIVIVLAVYGPMMALYNGI